MEKLKRTRNLYKALQKDEQSIFFANEKLTKQIIKKANRSTYEKDKVFLTLYKNVGDVNIQAEEVIILSHVPFVEKKTDVVDLHYIVSVDPLNFYMQILLTLGFLPSLQQILTTVYCL